VRTTPDIRNAVEAWADATVPALNTYDTTPEDIGQAMPIVMAQVQRDRFVESERQLPRSIQQYQQTGIRVWVVELTLLVTADPPEAAETELNDYVDLLTADLIRNRTLGGRVEVSSPFYDANYPGEYEHPSGVVARAAVLQLTVGEQTEVPT
jgi:hypothetical protein